MARASTKDSLWALARAVPWPARRRRVGEAWFEEAIELPRRGYIRDLLGAVLTVLTQDGERLVGRYPARSHQDTFRLLDDGAAAERAPESVIFGEALERDVDRGQELGSVGVDDVGEHAALGRLATPCGSSAVSSAMTGQLDSETIRSIRSRACSDERPSPTSATSGCSRAVTAATSATSVSRATTTCPRPVTTSASGPACPGARSR